MNNYPITVIFGGGGFIGRYLTRILTKKNHRLIIPTRAPFQKVYLKTQAPPGHIDLIDFNPGNFSAMKEAIENADYVINLCGILFENRKQKFNSVHAGIPESIAKICSQSKVKKFISVSALGSSRDSKSKYQQSKFLGEEKALNNFNKTVIIRPSVVVGNEDNFTNLFAKMSLSPIIPVVKKSYLFEPIFVNDVAKAILKAIETKNNEGKIYELGGGRVISFGDMIKLILKIIGKKRIVAEVPMPLAKIQGSLLSLLPIDPVITKDQCIILSEKDNVVSGDHLTLEDLKIKPSDIEKEMETWLFRYAAGGEYSRNKNKTA